VPSVSIPRRPARPVNWVYAPGVSASWPSPVKHDRSGGHVDAEGQGLGGEDEFEETFGKEDLGGFLEGRHEPCVVSGDAGLKIGEPPVVAQHRQVARVEVGGLGGSDVADSGGFVGRSEPQPEIDGLVCGRAATGSGEDEVDGRQQAAPLQELTCLESSRHAVSLAAGMALQEPQQRRVGEVPAVPVRRPAPSGRAVRPPTR